VTKTQSEFAVLCLIPVYRINSWFFENREGADFFSGAATFEVPNVGHCHLTDCIAGSRTTNLGIGRKNY